MKKVQPPAIVSEDDFIPSAKSMSMRDYFAAAALQGLLACSRIHEIKDGHESDVIMVATADWSYKLADAMLAARPKGGAS